VANDRASIARLHSHHQPPRAGHSDRATVLRVLLVAYGVLTVSLIAIGVLLTDVLDTSVGRWDNDVNRWFADHRTHAWNSLTGVATFMLNTFPVIAVAALVVVLLVWRHRWRDALIVVFGLCLEITVFLSVTFIVDRPRPHVVALNSAPATSSFPSGHTAAAVVLYGGIALITLRWTRRLLLRTLAWILAAGAGVTVALSRVYRGMHHPTDVMVGALLGIACLWVAVIAVRALSKPDDANRHTAKTDEPTANVRPPEAVEWDVVA
jgi:membrane-associated phospholipid phosphatase